MSKENESILKRLDALIYLAMKQNPEEKDTPVSQMIKELSKMGLDLDVIKYFGEPGTGRKIRWGHQ